MRALIVALSVAVTFAFAACGSSGGGGVADTGGSPGVITTPPPVSPYDISQCQPGQIFHPNYGCLNRNSCQAGYGWIPGEYRCVQGTVVTSTTTGRFFGSLSVTNQDIFAKALQYLGTSPFQCNYWTYNTTNYQCKTYANAGFLFINPNSSDVVLSIGAGVSNPNSYDSTSIYWGGSRYLGTESFASVQLYNNSQGIRMVGKGLNGQPNGLTAVVDNGNLTSASMQVNLLYQGVQFATVVVDRF